MESLGRGDQAAFLQLSELVRGFLARLGAYDFLDEWPDLIQEVLMATLTALKQGKIRDRKTVGAAVFHTNVVEPGSLSDGARSTRVELGCPISTLTATSPSTNSSRTPWGAGPSS